MYLVLWHHDMDVSFSCMKLIFEKFAQYCTLLYNNYYFRDHHHTMGISASEKRINKGGWKSKNRQKSQKNSQIWLHFWGGNHLTIEKMISKTLKDKYWNFLKIEKKLFFPVNFHVLGHSKFEIAVTFKGGKTSLQDQCSAKVWHLYFCTALVL